MQKLLREIDSEIALLEAEKSNVKGTTTEVYTRIVGYHRAISNWNLGKKEEYTQRKTFTIDKIMSSGKYRSINNTLTTGDCCKPEFSITSDSEDIGSFLFFSSLYCRNCGPMKNFIEEGNIKANGENVDVSTELGVEIARKYNVSSTPALIFFDGENNEIFRTSNLDELKTFLQASSIAATA